MTKNINEHVNDLNRADPSGIGNVPEGLQVNDELTAAAREGADAITPAFASLKPKQQAKIIKALRKNNRPRLEGILEDYARTLTAQKLSDIHDERY